MTEAGSATVTGASAMRGRVARKLFGIGERTFLGKYELLEPLGSGAMGVVYAAYDTSLRRRVAVKVLRQRAGVSTVDRTRMLREAHALAKLSHPNVVHVYEAGEDRADLYIVMELIEGASLRAWLREQPRSWREVVDAYRDAGAGLYAAHLAGVIHRDFKPANVLVGVDARARVVDFGLAHVDGAAGDTHDAAIGAPGRTSSAGGGTPAYMAPERLRGAAADERSDQYSFCAALREALVRGCPRYIRSAVERGLMPNREQRWSSMEPLLTALDHRVRRQKRTRQGAVVILGGAALGGAAQAWHLYAENSLRQRDAGTLNVELRAFDIDPATGQAVPGDAERMRGALHRFTAAEAMPGDEYPASAEFVSASPDVVVLRLEAAAGPAFLRVDRPGCSASWIPIAMFPGYASREEPATVAIAVPSCEAALQDTVEIPAGDFVYSGAGDPPTSFASYVQDETIVAIPAFHVGRFEVSRRHYAHFATLEQLTGFGMPRATPERTAPTDEYPVANVTWFEASAYCAYMGGVLPTTEQWEKSLRGGLTVGAALNPEPRRNMPWGRALEPLNANLVGDADGSNGAAPLADFPRDESPYGVRALAGNVREWTRSIPGHEDEWAGMRVVRGSAFDTAAAAEEHFAAYENMRDPKFAAFDLGFRCVFEPAR